MRYKEYKKVGIPWLNEIPTHWEEKNINNLFDERIEKVSDKDFTPLSVTKNGILPQLENVAKSMATDNRKKVLEGDFVINSRSDRKGSSGISEYDGSVSLISTVIIPRQGYSKFWHYLLKSNDFVEEFYRNGRGIVADLWTTNFQNMKSIVLPIPPKEEQEQIARFLDWKINEIYRLISIREKQIKNLEKTRRIVTIDTMLNNDYKSVMLSRCASENKRRNTNSNQNLLSLSYGKIIRKDINSTFGLLPEKFDKYQLVDKGNIILRLTDLQNDHKSLRVGLVKEKGIITSAYIGLICNDMVIPEYLYYYLNAMDLRKDFYSMGAGVRQNLNYNELRKINIKLPDKDTQKYIIDYLNENENRIKKIIKIKEKQINNLKQLKQSLISDVVTGKVDVRNVSIPEYDKSSNIEDDYILEENFEEEV